MCGEHGFTVSTCAPSAGPSPRVRGTLPSFPIQSRTFAVHPRVCGEHALKCQADLIVYRSIPACAGNTSEDFLDDSPNPGPSPRVRGTPPGRASAVWWWPVHPRVCGEHAVAPVDPVPLIRSIPACAGNTNRPVQARDAALGPSPRVRGTPPNRLGSPSARPVHPRVCGEHLHPLPQCPQVGGPSPRVRGTRTARAGPPMSAAVHPRVCGEHPEKVFASAPMFGPSPRVRGTLPAGGLSCRARRSIPACAGNTRLVGFAESMFHGPSPRVRGTLPAGGLSCRARRSIPACAGNTAVTWAVMLAIRGPSPRVRGTRRRGRSRCR